MNSLETFAKVYNKKRDPVTRKELCLEQEICGIISIHSTRMIRVAAKTNFSSVSSRPETESIINIPSPSWLPILCHIGCVRTAPGGSRLESLLNWGTQGARQFFSLPLTGHGTLKFMVATTTSSATSHARKTDWWHVWRGTKQANRAQESDRFLCWQRLVKSIWVMNAMIKDIWHLVEIRRRNITGLFIVWLKALFQEQPLESYISFYRWYTFY